jgi:hypothetical protein
MGIYLFGASILGSYEQQLLRANHLDVLLAEFNLFGLPMRVSTSTVVFLASLILILVILARFDLIPRSFSAMSGTSTQGARQPERKTSKGEEGRGPQPTMRQGVKGADDKLYQEYRAHQRREKKR